MINLRNIANQVSQSINANETVSLKRSVGYAIGTGRKQSPLYAGAIDVIAQIQALDADDLKQLSGLNIQGTLRAMYITGPQAAVVRPTEQGGDMVTRADGSLWLTLRVLETWPTWTKTAIILQEPE